MSEEEKLTTEHELWVSVGLHHAMKPSVFRETVNTALFENIGYMKSWGVHTKSECIALAERAIEENQVLKQALAFYANAENWKKKEDGHMGFVTKDPSNVEEDEGQRARNVLKTIQGGKP